MFLVPLTPIFPKGLKFVHHSFTICKVLKNVTLFNSDGLMFNDL